MVQTFFQRNLALRAALLIAFLATFHSVADAAPAAPLAFDFSASKGVSLSYGGVPLTYKSTLYVVEPGWKSLLYDQREQKQQVLKNADGSWRVTSENGLFRAEYDLRLLDAQTFEMRFRGELLKDVPAQIEFNAGYVNANPIANRPFRAVLREGAGAGSTPSASVVPAFPAKEGLHINDLAPGFESLEFDSRFGKMSLEVISKTPALFADARRHSLLQTDKTPMFWLGWTAGMQPLKMGQPVEMTVKFHLEPPALAAPQQVSIRPATTKVPNAFDTGRRPLEILPKPKAMHLDAEKKFALSNVTRWSVTAPPGETRLSAAVQNVMSATGKLKLAAPRRTGSTPGGWCGVRLGDGKPVAFPAALATAKWAAHPDSYRLTVDKNGVQIVSPTARGAFYGVQTLAQLMRSGDKNLSVPFAEIEDWPTLEFRGAHWFPSQSGVPFHKKLIGIMARYKMNAAVIQCEAARWDSHPEIAGPNSISTKDLRELVELCRANFIEPIPLINGPGHAEWMFRNGQNLDLAEDPVTPYSYAVNNPKSLEFVREIMSEAIEIFQPKILSLGFDEVTMRGRFPNPANPLYRKDLSVTDLVLTNLRQQHEWLAKRGIKTMIWGDMFLSDQEGVSAAHAKTLEEAQMRRAAIPKDVIIADWHYNEEEKYLSLNLFQKEGLKTIAAPWYRPLNVHSFTEAAIANNAWGTLQTTWAGYFPDEKTLGSEARQFSVFVLAADYSWSGRSESPDALPYDISTRWIQAYNPQAQAPRGGTLIDLSAAAQVESKNWLGLGEGWDLNAFFASHKTAAPMPLGDVEFLVPAHRFVVLSSAPAAMAPAGALKELNLQVKQIASEIAFLHAALWNVEDATKVAHCIVEYADGTRSEIEFTSAKNIAPWQGGAVTADAAGAWKGRSPNGKPSGLYVMRWKNPHPKKTIARLHLQPADPQAGYALAGITMID